MIVSSLILQYVSTTDFSPLVTMSRSGHIIEIQGNSLSQPYLPLLTHQPLNLPEPDEPSPQPSSSDISTREEEDDVVAEHSPVSTSISFHPDSQPLTTSTPKKPAAKEEPVVNSEEKKVVAAPVRQKRPCPIPECKGALHVNMWNHIFQTHKSQGKYSSKFSLLVGIHTTYECNA